MTAKSLENAFRRVMKRHVVPHQSKGSKTRFPGATRAAADLGVSRAHLHRVLTGERQSAGLLSRWHAWLKRNPEFARLNKKTA